MCGGQVATVRTPDLTRGQTFALEKVLGGIGAVSVGGLNLAAILDPAALAAELQVTCMVCELSTAPCIVARRGA